MWLGLVVHSFVVSTLFSGVPFSLCLFLLFSFSCFFFRAPFLCQATISGILGMRELRLSRGIKIRMSGCSVDVLIGVRWIQLCGRVPTGLWYRYKVWFQFYLFEDI